MGINQAVTTTFKGRDEQSKIFNKMGRSSKKFGETSSRAFNKLNKSATKASTVMKGFLGAQVIGKGVGLLGQGIQSVTTDFLGFDNAILSSAAKFKGLNLTTEKGIKTLNALKKTAREVGATTENNAAQAAQGLDFLALAGFDAFQAMALLPGVTNLATVAQVDLAEATDIASDSLGAFGLMTSNTEQLTKNFTRVQDVMAKTTASSNTNLTDMFEAVKKGAPDFTAAGQTIETFSTLIGTMANAGIKGSEAGTKLRNMATRLAKPTKEAAELIEKLGIRVGDGKGKFRDMLDIINDVRKGTSKLGKVQKTAALATIFGTRQTGGLNVILAESDKKLKSYRKTLEESTGSAAKMAKIMRSSLLNQLKSLGSAATEVGFQLFSAFSDQGSGAIEQLTSAIRTIDLAPAISGIKKGWEKMKPIFMTMKTIVGDVWGFLADTGVFDLAAKGFRILGKAIGPIGKAFELMWRAIKPILNAFGVILTPIVKGLSVVLDAIGVTLDSLDKKLAKTIEKQDRLKAQSGGQSAVEIQRREQNFRPVAKSASELEREARLGTSSRGQITKKRFFGQSKKDFEKFTSSGLLPALIGEIAPNFAAGRGEAVRKMEQRTQVQQQNVNVGGKLTIAGAPDGSKFEAEPGSIPIDATMTGASPAEM